MPYLIDGHNLIGQLPDIDLTDPNDEAKLVQKLSGWVARSKQKCVVVFDGGLPGGASRMSTKQVKVVFASHRSNADAVMQARIRKEGQPKNWTVVSSDNEVLSSARRRRMNTIRSQQFAALLQRPAPPPKPGLDTAADVRLSEAEVEEWMAIFQGRD